MNKTSIHHYVQVSGGKLYEKKRIVDVLFRAVITTMNVVNSTPTLKEELACLW